MAVSRKSVKASPAMGHHHGGLCSHNCFGVHCLKLGAAFAGLYLLCALLAWLSPLAYLYLLGTMTHGSMGVTFESNSTELAESVSKLDLSGQTLFVGTLAWLLAGYLLSCLICYSKKVLGCECGRENKE